MTEQTTTVKHFDPHGRNGAGQSGYLATTAAGIERFGATPEAAVRSAEAQEAIYREAGTLDQVRVSLGLTDPTAMDEGSEQVSTWAVTVVFDVELAGDAPTGAEAMEAVVQQFSNAPAMIVKVEQV